MVPPTLLEEQSKLLHSAACRCQDCYRLTTDHDRFLEDMPQDPEILMADFQKMGLFKPESIAIADRLTTSELRQALFFKNASQGDPEQGSNAESFGCRSRWFRSGICCCFWTASGSFFQQHSS
ncbi:unknown protein [Synechococcus elongatus PCC 6301]|uniref:Uncharacterized protein n=1 Tax=Synechococcus sp. (strain ATCC 27144 / PCC 6301 / SAUG 1402/1) TaxID=269084 RepID=A0A0H3KBC7_SYNP6|nr:unknown protein [Synechococcus elongatus PCC 6301]